MPTPTYTLINSTTLTATSTTVEFSSIPNTYTDLVLRFSTRQSTVNFDNETLKVRLNGVTATNYSVTYLRGNSSAGSSSRTSSANTTEIGYSNGGTSTASTFANGEIYIPSYTVAQNKPFLGFSVQESNSAAQNVALLGINAALFSNTAVITSISIYGDTNFVTSSTFWLYGIKNS